MKSKKLEGSKNLVDLETLKKFKNLSICKNKPLFFSEDVLNRVTEQREVEKVSF